MSSRSVRVSQYSPSEPAPTAFPALTPAAVIKRLTRHNALDPRLAPADRWLARWASGQGSGLPNPEWDVPLRSRVPPLDDSAAIITDAVVLSLPWGWRTWAHSWYRSEASCAQIAQRAGLSRSAAYVEHKLLLAYVTGRLRSLGVQIGGAET